MERLSSCLFFRNRLALPTRTIRVVSSSVRCAAPEKDDNRVVHFEDAFARTPAHLRTKSTFLALVSGFQQRGKGTTRGHVELINTALNHLKDYNLHKDLDTYKALLNVFPKGPLIPQNRFQKTFLHYPAHQLCCVRVLDSLEWHGVQPDKELHDIVVNAFGEWNYATRKMKRMLYWMPKLKHSNRYFDRRLVEGKTLDGLQLATLALTMMSRDPGTDVTSDTSAGGTWIASAQSPLQRRILESIETTSLTVDGPFLVYVMEHRVPYFVLNGPAPPVPVNEFVDEKEDCEWETWRGSCESGRRPTSASIHEQSDGSILALGAFAANSKQSALEWIRMLQSRNPRLEQLDVLLRIRQ